VRQEIRELAHQVDARLLVLDADVHVHAADQQPPRRRLQLAAEAVVALLVGMALVQPARERMRGRGDRRTAVAVRHLADAFPHARQLLAHFGDALAHLGAHLDLRAQELGADLAARFHGGLALLDHRLRHVGDQVARLAIHEQVLFLHPIVKLGSL
jgi:hypothetical protein